MKQSRKLALTLRLNDDTPGHSAVIDYLVANTETMYRSRHIIHLLSRAIQNNGAGGGAAGQDDAGTKPRPRHRRRTSDRAMKGVGDQAPTREMAPAAVDSRVDELMDVLG